MEKNRFDLNQSEKIILEAVRRNMNISKSGIVDKTGLPWSTVTVGVGSLDALGWVKDDKKSKDVSFISDVWFAGISVGSSNIKIAIGNGSPEFELNEAQKISISEIDKFMNDINEKNNTTISTSTDKVGRWRCITPTSYVSLVDLLSGICNILIKQYDNFKFDSFLFTFPGYVDYDGQKNIDLRCSNLPIKLSNISELLKEDTLKKIKDNHIDLIIDHNVKTSGTYEFCRLKNQLEEPLNDAIVMYLGLGLGLAIVINNALYRGHKNQSGQFGHIQINDIRDDKYINNYFSGNTIEKSEPTEKDYLCSCGQHKCLEQILRVEVFYPLACKIKGKQYDINNFSLNEETYKQYMKEVEFSNIAKKLENEDPIYRRKLAFYIGEALSNLIKILSIKDVIFAGRLAEIYPGFKLELKEVLMNNKCEVAIHLSEEGTFSSALGAIEVAYHRKLNIPLI